MNAFVDKSDTITQVLPALYAALLELDEGIKKTKKNGLSYAYHDNEDVVTGCRKALLNNGLMLHTNGGAITEAGKRLFQEFVFTITHAMSGEYVAFSWGGVIPAGLIMKSGDWLEDDKASGKLKSYSLKNWLLAEFMIGTPDQDTETGNYAQQQYQQSQPAPRRTITNPPAKRSPTFTNPDLGMDTDGADYATDLTDTYVDENGEIVLPPESNSDAAFDAIPSAFPDTAPIGTSQHKALMATFTQMKITDDERHNLMALYTQDRTRSSKDLTIVEFTRLMKLLKIWQAGLLAGDEKWNATVTKFAEKVSGDTVHNFFLLNDAHIVVLHAKVLKWLHDGNITVPAKFNQL